MTLKYDCISHSPKTKSGERDYTVRLWKCSATNFVSIANLALVSLASLPVSKDIYPRVWDSIVKNFDKTIQSKM